jgi:hypothetical protein
MVDISLPNHVVIRRRDGRQEVLLHRSMAVISDDKIEIKSARGAIFLPLAGLVIAAGAIAWMILQTSAIPLWALVVLLVFCLFLVPVCFMGIISAVAGADVVIDGKKGSATWQQGYLGMGIGTKELVPFAKIDHLEIGVEGAEGDRWRGEDDALRQFSLTLVKKSGKELKLAQVPVPAFGQTDGMDRTLAVANAVAALTGTTVVLPEGWELVEINTDTGDIIEPKTQRTRKRRAAHGRRH